MSGIVGVWHLDERPVEKDALARMVKSLAHRGPDASGIWTAGSVGFGHAMLWGTPQAPREPLPLANSNNGLAITADARIDNRADLIERLNLGAPSQETITDSELILQAYEKWGEDCVANLVGDFAFAIWDSRNQALFLARDHLGVKPLCYYHSERIFAFSSEVKALFHLSDVPRRINEARIADFLVGDTEDINHTCTFYQEVFRFPPAQTTLVRRTKTETKSYWLLDPAKEIHCASDDEYAEAFLEIFTEAVDCRLRGISTPGSMLSGGVDSSSIVGVAHGLLANQGKGPLHTFSRLSDDATNCAVTRGIDEVIAALPGLHSHRVTCCDVDPFVKNIEPILENIDDLFDTNLMNFILIMYSLAHKRGFRALFDGVDGDIATSNQERYIEFILRSGHFMTAVKEVFGNRKYLGNFSDYDDFPSPWKTLALWGGRAFVPSFVKRMGIVKHIVAKIFDQKPEIDYALAESLIDTDFAKKIDLKSRYAELRKNRYPSVAKNLREQQIQLLRSPILTVALERYDRMASAFSLEARHPLLDKRLIEFCLALPWQQNNRNGFPKEILRRSLSGFLPKAVRYSPSVGTFYGRSPTDVWLEKNRADVCDFLLERLGHLRNYVKVDVIQDALNMFKMGRESETDRQHIWTAVVLGTWLAGEAGSG
jgi:asparagine synthase (glutamine-hydrolysing)